jgi:hypothetical protein
MLCIANRLPCRVEFVMHLRFLHILLTWSYAVDSNLFHHRFIIRALGVILFSSFKSEYFFKGKFFSRSRHGTCIIVHDISGTLFFTRLRLTWTTILNAYQIKYLLKVSLNKPNYSRYITTSNGLPRAGCAAWVGPVSARWKIECLQVCGFRQSKAQPGQMRHALYSTGWDTLHKF